MRYFWKFSFIWFFVLYILITSITYGNHHLAFPFVLGSFTGLSFMWFKVTKGSVARGLVLLSTLFVLLILAAIIFFQALLEVSVSYIIAAILSVVAGRLLHERKITSGAALFLFPIAFYYILTPNLRQYRQNEVFHQEAFNSAFKFDLYGRQGEKISLDSNKIIVMDFWHTRCGVCFKNFPNFNALKKKFIDNDKVVFYSVNVPLRREVPDSSLAMFKELGYDLDAVYIQNKELLEKNIRFNSYPHYVIVQNGKILFSGKFDWSPVVFYQKPDDLIESLLSNEIQTRVGSTTGKRPKSKLNS